MRRFDRTLAADITEPRRLLASWCFQAPSTKRGLRGRGKSGGLQIAEWVRALELGITVCNTAVAGAPAQRPARLGSTLKAASRTGCTCADAEARHLSTSPSRRFRRRVQQYSATPPRLNSAHYW